MQRLRVWLILKLSVKFLPSLSDKLTAHFHDLVVEVARLDECEGDIRAILQKFLFLFLVLSKFLLYELLVLVCNRKIWVWGYHINHSVEFVLFALVKHRHLGPDTHIFTPLVVKGH